MATVMRAPERLTAAQRKTTVTLYLAGPFDDDDPWRDEVIDAFSDVEVTVVDPRNDRWATLDPESPGRRGAYEWQCSNAVAADVVLIWVPQGAHAPTALMILGALGAKRNTAARGSSVVVGGGGWGGLVQLFAQNQRLFPAGDELADLIRLTRLQVEAALAAKAGR